MKKVKVTILPDENGNLLVDAYKENSRISFVTKSKNVFFIAMLVYSKIFLSSCFGKFFLTTTTDSE